MILALAAPHGMDAARASDRDLPPYMIYIDPETGKYTTTPPGHEPAAAEAGKGGEVSGGDTAKDMSPAVDRGGEQATQAAAAPAEAAGSGAGKAIYLAGGALLLAMAGALGIVIRRRRQTPSTE